MKSATVASSGGSTFTRRILPLERATIEALKPFGAMLARPAPELRTSSRYYSHINMSYPVDFQSAHPVELALASLRRRPGDVRYLERHFQHTQTFIPLGGKPFVLVLAPPTTTEMPDLPAARAFYFDGREGFALNLGVWHEFPFALEDDTDMVVVLSSQTGYDLTTKDPQTQEALGPDLDKKDISARTGLVLAFDLDAHPVEPSTTRL